MNDFKHNLLSLSDAVISGDGRLVIDGLKQNSRISKAKQLSVYTEGYIERLLKAVESDFPTLIYYFEKYKNRKELQNIILSFIKENPSRSYNLDKYPLGFYNFFIKNCNDEFAKDLALLEHNIIEVFQAPDSDSLLPQKLANLSEEQLANTKFKLRTASCLREFDYNVEKFLSDFRAEIFSDPIKVKTCLFICRHNNEVIRHLINSIEYLILKEIGQGNSFSESLNKVIELSPLAENIVAQNLQSWFSKWLIEGFFDTQVIL